MASMHYRVVGATHDGYPTYTVNMTVEFRNLSTDVSPFRTRIIRVDANATLADARENIRTICREEAQKQIEDTRANAAVQAFPTGVLNYEETYTWT